MKLKLITKVLTLRSKPEKLRELVFHSLSSCSFTLLGGPLVTSRQAPKRNIFRRKKNNCGVANLQNCFEINKN